MECVALRQLRPLFDRCLEKLQRLDRLLMLGRMLIVQRLLMLINCTLPQQPVAAC
jgi:hypothetical protein